MKISAYIELSYTTMEPRPERKLIKGRLGPPRKDPQSRSYVQPPTSKDEITVRRGKEREVQGKRKEISLL